MAAPVNPYKAENSGDGINVPSSLILDVGEIISRDVNGALVAVPAGTEGQVPTYQADGTIAPADGGGGAGGGVTDYAIYQDGSTVHVTTAWYYDIDEDWLTLNKGSNITVAENIIGAGSGILQLQLAPGIYSFVAAVSGTMSTADTNNLTITVVTNLVSDGTQGTFVYAAESSVTNVEHSLEVSGIVEVTAASFLNAYVQIDGHQFNQDSFVITTTRLGNVIS